MYGGVVTSITRYGCLVSGASNASRQHPPFLMSAFTSLRPRMKCCNLITQEITCSEMRTTIRHARNATFHLRSSSLFRVSPEFTDRTPTVFNRNGGFRTVVRKRKKTAGRREQFVTCYLVTRRTPFGFWISSGGITINYKTPNITHKSALLTTRQFFTVIITITQLSSSGKLTDSLSGTDLWNSSEAEAEAYCRQSAGTVIPGIEPRWHPWP
jgi:hypothetical protein